MKAMRVQAFGLETPMRLDEVDEPAPGRDELLVRLHAAGVNPSDVATRSGKSHHSGHHTPPYVPGLEASGEVIGIGEGVQGFEVGCRAFGACAGGAYAEVVRLRAPAAAVVPDNMTHEEAAGVTLGLRTAWNALVIKAKAGPGESVLVQGGAGGVGSAAIQLARRMGCRVFATVSSEEKAAFCRELGAEETINYRREDFAERCLALTDGRGVDVIIESAGFDNFDKNLDAICVDGRIVLMGAGLGKNQRAGFRVPAVMTKDARIFGVTGVNLARKMPEVVPRFLPMLRDGSFKVHVGAAFPLAEANAAHELMLSGKFLGKIVLTP